MVDKDILTEKLKDILKQESEIRKQLDDIEYNERYNTIKQFEGKCFKVGNILDDDYIRCLYVYDIDKIDCKLMSLSINYWKDNYDSHFNIEYYDYFEPSDCDDDSHNKWFEIDKDEYILHYNEVQKRIKTAFEYVKIF